MISDKWVPLVSAHVAKKNGHINWLTKSVNIPKTFGPVELKFSKVSIEYMYDLLIFVFCIFLKMLNFE